MKAWQWDYIEDMLRNGESVSALVEEGYDREDVEEALDNLRDSWAYYDAVDWAWNHR